MSSYDSSSIRNVGLVSHVGTGKTSLADAMLFDAGQNTRLGKVDAETSLMDYEPEEIKRRTTISASIASFDWKKARINLVDTPGGANFIADSRTCLQGLDSAVIVLDAIDGLKVQSIKLVKQAQSMDVSLAIFINKMERENSNYKPVIEGLGKTFAAKPVMIQLPIGQEASFTGRLDSSGCNHKQGERPGRGRPGYNLKRLCVCQGVRGSYGGCQEHHKGCPGKMRRKADN
jgi:elongation factor G